MIYSQERAIKAAKSTLVLKTGAQALGIAVTILLVNLLTEVEYGVYNTLISLITIIGAVLSLGISNTLQRYIPAYVNKSEFNLARKIERFAFYARFISVALVCLVGGLYFTEISGWLSLSGYEVVALPFAFVVILYFQTRLLAVILSSYLHQGVNQAAQICLVLTKFILYVALARHQVEVQMILAVDVTAYTLMLIILSLGYLKYIHPLRGGRTHFEQHEQKGILKYAAFNNLNDVGVVSLGRDVDVLFIAAMLDAVSAGAYAFANRISHSLKQISPVRYFIDIIRPLFFTLDPKESPDKVSMYFNLLLKLNYVFELPMMCSLFVAYPYLIAYVFDGKYHEYQLMVTMVFAIVILSSFGLYVGLVAHLRERADILFYSKIFAIVNIIGNIMLIPVLGVYGAVLSTMGSALGKNLFVFWFVKQEIDVTPFLKFIVASIIYWLAVALVSDFITTSLGISILSGVVGVIIILLSYRFYIKIHLFDHCEVNTLHGMARGHGNKLKLVGV